MTTSTTRSLLSGLIAVLALLASFAAAAHESRFTTLTLNLGAPGETSLEVEIAVLDLELALGLDADDDGAIVWREYEQHRTEIETYITRSLEIGADDGECRLQPLRQLGGVRYGTEPTVVSVFSLDCPPFGDRLYLDQQLLGDIDAGAKAIWQIRGSGADKTRVVPLGRHSIDLADTGWWRANGSFLREGIHHILIGYDHLAFLLLLILPAARQGSNRERMLSVIGIVTAFTLAHSVTLALSATGLLHLPGAAVEAVIAASIVVAGLVNLARPLHRMSWMIAYAFGLVHGFGFAGALSDLAIAENLRLFNLAAFNIGVEIGQLAIVLLVMPVLFLLGRDALLYRRLVRALSLLVSALGGFWLLERMA